MYTSEKIKKMVSFSNGDQNIICLLHRTCWLKSNDLAFPHSDEELSRSIQSHYFTVFPEPYFFKKKTQKDAYWQRISIGQSQQKDF